MKIKQLLRDKFRNDVLERDGYKCKVCGIGGVKLDSHHIVSRKNIINGGYCKENGISLCDRRDGCHWKAELFNSNYTPEYIIKKHGEELRKYSPNELFKLIKSSYEIACKKSEKL